MHAMATDQNASRVHLTVLSPEHLSAVNQAFSNILSSDLALETYAQVANGLPVPRPCDQKYLDDWWWFDDNPNPEPSDQAHHIVERFRDNFNIEEVEIAAEVVQRFGDEAPTSSQFYLRLIELVITICHDLAALLFNLVEGGLRKPVVVGMSREGFASKTARSTFPPYVTVLSHHDYHRDEYYPRGPADIVGYWAEDRLFGGVVLFDRGNSGVECNGVFLNSTTQFRFFQLTDSQVRQFIGLLTESTNERSRTTLPFQAAENTRTIHPNESLNHNIYRNQYDCRTFELKRPSCVRHPSSGEAEWLRTEYEWLANSRN